MPSEANLVAVLAESEAGLFSDGDTINRDVYADADRLEAELGVR